MQLVCKSFTIRDMVDTLEYDIRIVQLAFLFPIVKQEGKAGILIFVFPFLFFFLTKLLFSFMHSWKPTIDKTILGGVNELVKNIELNFASLLSNDRAEHISYSHQFV